MDISSLLEVDFCTECTGCCVSSVGLLRSMSFVEANRNNNRLQDIKMAPRALLSPRSRMILLSRPKLRFGFPIDFRISGVFVVSHKRPTYAFLSARGSRRAIGLHSCINAFRRTNGASINIHGE